MGNYKSFEDLEVWQRARVLANRIYALTLVGTFGKDYSLKDQINASSGSVMDNIAEGFERGGNKEFVMFLSYSKGSAGEVRSQLPRAFDRAHITKEVYDDLNQEALAVGKMLGGFMQYLQNKDFRGSKFHEPNATYGSVQTDSQNPV